jgi:hypothetical protein
MRCTAACLPHANIGTTTPSVAGAILPIDAAIQRSRCDSHHKNALFYRALAVPDEACWRRRVWVGRPARCPPAFSILAQGDLTAWLGM